MKKLINNPEVVVEEMLQGMVAAYPQFVKKLEGFNVVVRADAPVKGKVALVSGGGSGHEPAHAGYVGKGMLDAGVAGAVFTSPTPDQIFEAIKAVDGGAGVLLIIKNYTGDVMNFQMAGEMAEMEGIKVDSVVVNDDVAVENSTYTVGRRGIAGTVFVHKIAGAKAQAGGTLEEVKVVAEKVIKNVRSMGMALTPCIVPAAGKPTFTIGEDEMEIGMGIHGEPGTTRTKLMKADEVVDHFMSKILADMPMETGDEVAVMVNGLSGTPLMELFILNRRASQILAGKGIKIYRTFVGEFMTSLEMAGASITLLKLDEELKSLLDAPADTPAFKQL
ncbi:PTS-dependent dihydroxyacetone kinase, dihydroxyacetone-binding subunit DhaK [Koleobacter methoxysyntrophicus]|uniref:phosphoenolpyruvate--glycerone phosphotransferase n=1 Tax=Koleobacter methoxysyntrophicus TaxID=2751313 RepID=A0A8A0RHR0_9FIRM|nr:dihydroxyacetone kinase subunit DhaK [Koleobacter methoxysyntrophicus]QSQ07775.1 PTS-dependent dihydroxyacetone kinase, dihydroxyacetone-binding subunit DhaK [Koleobacter methoxysyntrophicus]